MNNDKSQYSKSTGWSEIESWFTELIKEGIEFQPMLNLVKHIIKSEMKNRLYGLISMNKLIIGIYDEIEFKSETIHIEFDVVNRKWNLKYHPKPFRTIEFERTYSETEGIEKFESLIKYLKW